MKQLYQPLHHLLMPLQDSENLENIKYQVQTIVYVYISIVAIGNQINTMFTKVKQNMSTYMNAKSK